MMPSITNFWRMTFSTETMKLGTILSKTSLTNWQSLSRKQKSTFSQKTRWSSKITPAATTQSSVFNRSYSSTCCRNSPVHVVIASVTQQATIVSVVVMSLSCGTVKFILRLRQSSTTGCTARRKEVMPRLSVRLKPVVQAVRLELAAARTCGAKVQGLPNMQFFCFWQQGEAESGGGPRYTDCPIRYTAEMYSAYRSARQRTSPGFTWQQQRSMRAWPSTEVAGQYCRKQKPSPSKACSRPICSMFETSMLSSPRMSRRRAAAMATIARTTRPLAFFVSKTRFSCLLQEMFCSFCSLSRMISMSRSISIFWVALRLTVVSMQQTLFRMCSFWKCFSRFFQQRCTRFTFSSLNSNTICITLRPFRKQRAIRIPTKRTIAAKRTVSAAATSNWSASMRARFSRKVWWKRILVALIMWSQEGTRYMLSMAKSQPVRLIGSRPRDMMLEITIEQISTWSQLRPRLKESLRKGAQEAGALSAGSKSVLSVRGSELKARTFCVWEMIWLVTEAWLPTLRKFFMQFLPSAMGKRQRLRKLRNCTMLASTVAVSRRESSSSATTSPTRLAVSSRIAFFACSISLMCPFVRSPSSFMKMLFSSRRLLCLVVLKSRRIAWSPTVRSVSASLCSWQSGGRSGWLALSRQTNSSSPGSFTSTKSLKYLTAGTSSPFLVRKLVKRTAYCSSAAQLPAPSHPSTRSSCVHLNSSGISRCTGLPTISAYEYSTKLAKLRLTLVTSSVASVSLARMQKAFLSKRSAWEQRRSRGSAGARCALSPRKQLSSVKLRNSSVSLQQSRSLRRKKEQFMKMYRQRFCSRRYLAIVAHREELSASRASFRSMSPRTSVMFTVCAPIARQISSSSAIAASTPTVISSKVASARIMCSRSILPSKTTALKATLLSCRISRSRASRSCSSSPSRSARSRPAHWLTSNTLLNSFSTNSQQSSTSPASPGKRSSAHRQSRLSSACSSVSRVASCEGTTVWLRWSQSLQVWLLPSLLSMPMMKFSRSQSVPGPASEPRKVSNRLAEAGEDSRSRASNSRSCDCQMWQQEYITAHSSPAFPPKDKIVIAEGRKKQSRKSRDTAAFTITVHSSNSRKVEWGTSKKPSFMYHVKSSPERSRSAKVKSARLPHCAKRELVTKLRSVRLVRKRLLLMDEKQRTSLRSKQLTRKRALKAQRSAATKKPAKCWPKLPKRRKAERARSASTRMLRFRMILCPAPPTTHPSPPFPCVQTAKISQAFSAYSAPCATTETAPPPLSAPTAARRGAAWLGERRRQATRAWRAGASLRSAIRATSSEKELYFLIFNLKKWGKRAQGHPPRSQRSSLSSYDGSASSSTDHFAIRIQKYNQENQKSCSKIGFLNLHLQCCHSLLSFARQQKQELFVLIR